MDTGYCDPRGDSSPLGLKLLWNSPKIFSILLVQNDYHKTAKSNDLRWPLASHKVFNYEELDVLDALLIRSRLVLLLAERKRGKKRNTRTSQTEPLTADDVDEELDDIHVAPDYEEYVTAVMKVKEPLKITSEEPKNNSVLNSLRFYTREEQLDEYFCITCNEGLCCISGKKV